jgi:hypothetical protein
MAVDPLVVMVVLVVAAIVVVAAAAAAVVVVVSSSWKVSSTPGEVNTQSFHTQSLGLV